MNATDLTTGNLIFMETFCKPLRRFAYCYEILTISSYGRKLKREINGFADLKTKTWERIPREKTKE